jgi:hypothetical protein
MTAWFTKIPKFLVSIVAGILTLMVDYRSKGGVRVYHWFRKRLYKQLNLTIC